MPAAESCSTGASPRSSRRRARTSRMRCGRRGCWSRTRRAIVDAHLAYYRAGARVATTASYQATFDGFARRGIGRDEGASASCAARVELAIEARDRVAAEAPGGPLLRRGVRRAVRGDARRRLRVPGPVRAHRRAAPGLPPRPAPGPRRRPTADVLAVETIPEVEEAGRRWRSSSPRCRVRRRGSRSRCADGQRIRSGAPIEEAVAAVATTPPVLAVGINCTAPHHVPELDRSNRPP